MTEKRVLAWVNLADLFRIDGVGKEYSELLEASGVDSVPELALRNAVRLHESMAEVNEAKRLVRRQPNLVEVRGWIAQAKKLPRAVEH
ncbi:MAG: putative flap endonuclease-1-like 5' DNA nuclease [Planctomycetaceae bacterium]